jgi:hypothetical protein
LKATFTLLGSAYQPASKGIATQEQNMKKLSLTFFIAVSSIAAFAQGKVLFVNDSLHAYYIGDYTYAADAALHGQPVLVDGILPSGIHLMVDLYAGISSSTLSLITTTTFSSVAPGRQDPVLVTLPNIPSDVPAFFQVQIRDSAFGSASLAMFGSGYFGFSETFTVIPSHTIAYNSLVNPLFSTWTDGTYNLGTSGFGAIAVSLVPEPGTLSLISLGFATWFVSMRRK